MTGDRAVRNGRKEGIPVLALDRDIHKIHGTAAAVADGQIGRQDIRPVHLEEEILEAAAQIGNALPVAIPRGRQGREGAEGLECVSIFS